MVVHCLQICSFKSSPVSEMNGNMQSSDDLLLSFNQNSFCLSTSRAKMKELLRCAANIVIEIEIMQWFPKHLPGDGRGSGGDSLRGFRFGTIHVRR